MMEEETTMQALVIGERVMQIEAEPFAVAEPFHWVEAPEGCTTDWRWTGEALVPPPPPAVPELELARAEALARIDAEAEWQRQRYVTPGSGQAMVYLAKEQQARACLAAEDPEPADYPLLACTIGIERHPETGTPAATVTEIAEIVLAVAEGWLQVAGAIEAVRLAAKAAVEDAADAGAIANLFPLSWPG